MARPLRIDVEGGWYHVTSRGIERRAIFREDADRRHFLELLEAVREQFRLRIHAYCLMENHYHLLVETPEANLSRAMQWLKLSYSAWFNARYNRVGPLFQGRFKSTLVENSAWGHEFSVYVHLNPLRIAGFGLGKRDRAGARLGQGAAPDEKVLKERLQALRTYRWSSYRAYAGYAPVPAWLTTDAILGEGRKSQPDRVREYRRYVRTRLVEGADPDALDRIRDRVAIGSAAFAAEVRRARGRLKRETTGKRDIRKRRTFEEVVTAVEQVRGEPWSAFGERHGDPGNWLVLHLARRYTGMTLAELGAACGGMVYEAVVMCLILFARRLAQTPALQSMERRLAQMLDVEPVEEHFPQVRMRCHRHRIWSAGSLRSHDRDS